MQNFLDPAILFFVFGVLAGLAKSDLEIPPAIAKFLSLYLLMALGLKGGFALAASGLSPRIMLSLLAAILMAFIVPAMGYLFLRNRISRFDAAAVAASYGSVSAVTFVTAMQYLESNNMTPGGHMAAALVVMESPAIIMAVVIANALRRTGSAAAVVAGPGGAAVLTTGGAAAQAPGGGVPSVSLGKTLHESFTNGAHLLLLGAMAIGFISGESGQVTMKPFSGDLFKGMLAFFLLDMGLMVARNIGSTRGTSPVLLGYAALSPLVHAAMALALAAALDMPVGDAALLMVLSASASYIVVPAVVRYAIPEANPSIYFGLSLGITFPLNILAGIPLYTWVAQRVLT